MPPTSPILCDGCGQSASSEHSARRLKRLENMTRYRPLHVQALFLGAAIPANATDYLYSALHSFAGEGAALLRALGVEMKGRTAEATLADFQRRGYLLAYVLDCGDGQEADRREALRRRIPVTITRIRRSFKPKRIVLMGAELGEFVPEFTAANFDAALILQNGRPFHWHEISEGVLAKELAAQFQPL